MKIGIICKKGRTEPLDILDELIPWLEAHGVKAYCDPTGSCGASVRPPSCRVEDLPSKVDMAVVLGGDGTMLWAARMFSKSGVPLLGINLGGMGFITEVARKDILTVMEQVIAGEYTIERRGMIEVRHIRGGKTIAEYNALNDVVVNKGTRATVIRMEVSVNGTFVTRLKADGLIVATPTGSTAYSLSAGGPILYPTLNCLVLTPICPHTLTNRPIVLPDDIEAEITIASAAEDVILTHDGLVADTLKQGDMVVVRKAPYHTNLVMPAKRDHFEALRSKLKWGDR